jgi:tRNA nucleotidyltransferase (CCA-adding enzyme)
MVVSLQDSAYSSPSRLKFCLSAQPMGIKLECTERELQIFEVIRNHAKKFKDVVPRVAGGWVRDKVMGSTSNDMDIALENITGYSFAAGLGSSATGQSLTGIHVISNNPEKSKHLETAVTRINGMSVDFVNLRAERYTETRVPEVSPGTPEQDALRRDLTINALFYNLFTEEVEDFTGRGLEDIRKRVLATPADPLETLFDDPLRLVRIFRFYTKLGFKISEDIYEAMKDGRVRKALTEKISSERINIEITKIISYPNGHSGLLEIIRCNYVDPIFKPPVSIQAEFRKAVLFSSALEGFKARARKRLMEDILNLYVVLSFYSRMELERDKKREFVCTYIVRESLLFPRFTVKAVDMVEKNLRLLDGYALESISHRDLVSVMRSMGNAWYETLILFFCMRLMEGYEGKLELEEVIERIYSRELQDCYNIRPVINTRTLADDLGIPAGEMRHYIEEGVVYQIAEGVDDPAEILEYLRTKRRFY